MRGSLRMALWKGSTITTSNHLCIASCRLFGSTDRVSVAKQANSRQLLCWLFVHLHHVDPQKQAIDNRIEPLSWYHLSHVSLNHKTTNPRKKRTEGPQPPSRSSAPGASRICVPRVLPQWNEGCVPTSTC